MEIRFSASYGNQALEVAVNGVPHPVTLPSLPNDPQWRQTYWEIRRIENVSLTAGATNTIQLTASSGGGAYFAIDDVLVTTADHRAAAQPHRQVLTLPPADQAALLAYLRQLDGTPEANPTSAFLFGDGFESGDVGAWDRVVP